MGLVANALAEEFHTYVHFALPSLIRVHDEDKGVGWRKPCILWTLMGPVINMRRGSLVSRD